MIKRVTVDLDVAPCDCWIVVNTDQGERWVARDASKRQINPFGFSILSSPMEPTFELSIICNLCGSSIQRNISGDNVVLRIGGLQPAMANPEQPSSSRPLRLIEGNDD